MSGIPPKQVRSCFLDDPQLRAEVVEVTGIGADNAPDVHSPETQIMFTLNGAYYFCADGRESLIDTHQVAFIRPGLISKDRGVADGSATLLLLTPSPELLEHIFGVPAARVGTLRRFLQGVAPVSGKSVMGAQQLGHWATRVDDALALTEAAIALLRDVAGRGEMRDLPGPRPARLIDATKAVLAEETAPLSLDALARCVSANPAYLTDLFKRHEGISLVRYRSQLRLNCALARLPTSVSLTDLALELGYASHSHFTTAFRREFGVTPSEYRSQTQRGRANPKFVKVGVATAG